MGKRYCWARQAELSLLRGNPTLTLDTVERLIDSASGMRSGAVITFLWWLKGEALIALGRPEEAVILLHSAMKNAQELEEQFLLWRVHASFVRLHLMMNHQSEARKEILITRKLIDELADTVSERTLKKSFLEGAYNTVDLR
jgi:hypothetical protein